MLTILFLLALTFLVVGVGVGLYRGWFNFSSHNDHRTADLTLSYDKAKMEADTDKVRDLGHKAVDKIGAGPGTARR